MGPSTIYQAQAFLAVLGIWSFQPILGIWAKRPSMGQKVKKVYFSKTVQNNDIKPKGWFLETSGRRKRPEMFWGIFEKNENIVMGFGFCVFEARYHKIQVCQMGHTRFGNQ